MSAPGGRNPTIDVAKGLAITLVVLAHLDRGLIAAGRVGQDGPAWTIDLWLYSFFIPLFVFLSGLFLARSASRGSPGRFLAVRVSDLLWLYVVWSLINGLLQVVFNRFTNSDQSIVTVLTLWWPLGQMWFLPSLAFATVVVVLLKPWGSRQRQWWVLAGLLVVAVFSLQRFEVWPLAWLQPELAFYLALGAVLGHRRFTDWLARPPWWVLALIAAGATAGMAVLLSAGAAVPTTLRATPDGLLARIAGVACALLGIVTAAAVSELLVRLGPRVADPIAFLGVRSLPIYVSHTIFTAGVRAVLGVIGVEWLGAYLVGGLAAGLVGPLIIYWLATRLHMPWLYTRPRVAAVDDAPKPG